jgi:CRISPR-associated protein Cmr2
MTDFSEKLKAFLHDPIDKCFDIPGHIERAKKCAERFGVSGVEEAKGPDMIASCMERSLLPPDIRQEFNEIRHPFCERKLEVKYPQDEVLKKFAKFENKKLTHVKYYDDKKKFFYLWRNLQDLAFEGLKDTSWVKYTPLFPADTRIPDHSIWEHLKITSAINALEKIQNNSLFLFSIGPVQEFISQARKTQDLFMGSFLLSYLTFTGMREIIENYGPANIIYPDLFGQPLMDWYLQREAKDKGKERVREKIEVLNSFAEFVDQPTIPNRFVAIIPETDVEEIEKLVQRIEKRVKDEWKEGVNKVLDKFEIELENEFVKKQTSWFPEIYWVALPLKRGDKDIEIEDLKDFFKGKEVSNWKEFWKFAEEKGEHSPNVGFLYQLAYTALEKSMGARKNLKDFEQVEEYGKKCHLCGEREGKIGVRMGNLKVGKYISQNEGLCVACFTKRALDKYLEKEVGKKFKGFSFPSTAEVSSAYFKERALKKAKKEFENYVEKFREILGGEAFKQIKTQFLPKLCQEFKNVENIDGEWFFEENLTLKVIEKQFGIKNISEGRLNQLKVTIKKLTNKVKIRNQDKYYAIIKLDADNMGRWLSGELLPEIQCAYNSETWDKLPKEFKKGIEEIVKKLNNGKKFLTPAIHASISCALRNYSIEFVRRIIEEEHLGKLVYAGGDDVLALVNLKDLFEVMRKLRASFSGHITLKNGTMKIDWLNQSGFVEKNGRHLLTMGKNATASAGVVIAHYKMPLKMVLDKAKEAEKKAKDSEEKDSFVVVFMKHSGEERIAVSKWKCGELDILKKLTEINEKFKEQEDRAWVSDRFIYALREGLKRLKNKKGEFVSEEGVIDTAIRRIIQRSTHGGKKEERENLSKEVSNALIDVFWKLPGNNIDNFLDLLEISAFITTEEQI